MAAVHTATQKAAAEASSSIRASAPVHRPSGEKSIEDIRRELFSLIQDRRLVIPDGMPEIPQRLFDGHRGNVSSLRSIVIPGSVKSIGVRAFADCSNLEEVILSEGIERIDSNAFTGCEKLRKLQLPASIKEINGTAFMNSGIAEPVFSADGKVLIFYPSGYGNSEYTVPEGVEKIVTGAFYDAVRLEKIILPKSLKLIRSRAFVSCGFTEIAIPKDTEIEEKAFFCFKHRIRVISEDTKNALEEKILYCKVNGVSFLNRQRIELPQKQYWKEREFQSLAKQCAAGDVEAMDRMGDYFFDKADRDEDRAFYQCAAQFWWTRAYRYGSEDAKAYLIAWCEKNPDDRMASLALDERLWGAADGKLLNALGFPFFTSGREYSLSGVDQDGVVEVSSWESTEGPDEDGFGMEECYDWWYLNEHLVLPPSVGYIHSFSHNDKRCNEKKFLDLHDQVAALKRS